MAAGEGVMAVAAAETAKGRKMIKLKSCDGEERQMSVKAAMLSVILSHELEDIGVDVDRTIPLPNVASNALDLVIRYCEKHAEVAPAPAAAGDNSDPSSGAAASNVNPAPAPAKTKDPALEKWDSDFIDGLEQGPLFDLLLAANFLSIADLLDLACDKIASMMKGKTVVQVRKMFNIVSDFTKEEEDEIRKEQPGAFED